MSWHLSLRARQDSVHLWGNSSPWAANSVSEQLANVRLAENIGGVCTLRPQKNAWDFTEYILVHHSRMVSADITCNHVGFRLGGRL